MNSPHSNLSDNGVEQRSQSAAVKRWGGVVGGSALALYGLSRRSPAGLALAAAGGLLAYSNARTQQRSRQPVTHSSILLNTTPDKAYQFWRNFQDFPLFMRHLETVTDLGNGRSRWVALGPMGTKVRWDAEIIADHPNEYIAWRSLATSDVAVDGRVEFSKAPGNRGTLIDANIRYRAVKGTLPGVIAALSGKYPNFIIRQDLRRCKALMETGEIPTTEGQAHGPRTRSAAVARMLNPDQPIRGNSNIAEVYSAMRRSS